MIPISMDRFKAIVADPSYHGYYLNGKLWDRDDSIPRLFAGETPNTRSFLHDSEKGLFLLDPTRRELEAHYRAEGKSRSQAKMLAAEYLAKKEEKTIMSDRNENTEARGEEIPRPLTLENRIYGHDGVISIEAERPKAPTGRDYCSLFSIPRAQLRRNGFKNFNEYLTVLSSGKYDERLYSFRAVMSETVPSDGGFTVPDEFAAWLLDSSLESEIIRPRATVWPMKSDTLKVPGWDAATHTGGLFGGLTGAWLAELGTASETYAKTRQIQLNAKKLACYTSASNELVADGIDFERQIQTALIKTVSWFMDFSFIQGSGSGQPLGIINDPALITVAKEDGQQASTIVFENCVKMFSRVAPQCLGNAIWIASQTCVPQLLTMSLSVGTGGAPIQPAVLQSNGQFSLLGKPMIFSEKVPALGSAGQLILCDPSQYAIGMRSEVSLDKSIHVGWTQDTAAYRAIIRVDGQGTWDKAITPKAGDTLSWCVALAA